MSDANVMKKYLLEIEKRLKKGVSTEHSYRPALNDLLEGVVEKVTAINERKRIECGAPDFAVFKKTGKGDLTIGYVEAKDIGKSLDEIEKSDQMKRYLTLPNLILTDYLEFRWYVNGEFRYSARAASPSPDGKLRKDKDGVKKVGSLLRDFLTREPEPIGQPRELAVRLARLAHHIRDTIIEAFRSGNASDMLEDLRAAFAQTLIPDLDQPDKTVEFADMYAQTIAYGLFAARINHVGPEPFERDGARREIPRTNPFLRRLFEEITGTRMDSEPYAGFVNDLVGLLAHADMAAVLESFGKREKRQDPVIHFYETFLAAYDPKLREARGVYYTPEPVVSFIARSVDIILKERFGCPDGLADASTVKYARKNDKGKAEEVDSPKTLILDPACGTGTFLYNVVDIIRDSFRERDEAGEWSDYVKEKLLPRLFGFELLMAPYAVAHFKLGMQLAGRDMDDETRKKWAYDFAGDERLGIYLTNTLEEAERVAQEQFPFARYIAEEANAATKIKNELPILVVMGNPPYSGHSANRSWEKINGKKTRTFIGQLVHQYYFVDGKPLGERNPKWLQDDYVKFIRWAQWRIERTGSGILAFITNHGYLDNPTFRGMRRQLMRTFDDIYIIDLHGNAKKKEKAPDGSKDENVFDIQQGVAISIFIRNADRSAAFQAASDCQLEAGVTRRSRGHLPHWEQDGATYFVTFRLADSLPKHVVAEYIAAREKSNRKQGKPDFEFFKTHIEKHLDSGEGECHFNNPKAADLMEGALQHFDGQRYKLCAWCVMPNHVHVVFKPLGEHKLSEIVHAWKSFTSNKANKLLERKGNFWQREYYDRVVRDEDEFLRIIEYVVNNPLKAELVNWKWAGYELDNNGANRNANRNAAFQAANNAVRNAAFQAANKPAGSWRYVASPSRRQTRPPVTPPSRRQTSQQDAGVTGTANCQLEAGATEAGVTGTANCQLEAGATEAGVTGMANCQLEAGATDACAAVYHANLWGPRKSKYAALLENDVNSTQWTKLDPAPPFYLFIPQDTRLLAEYEKGWKITDIMPVNSVGIVTARDSLTIKWSKEEMLETVNNFISLPVESAREKYKLGKDVRDWKVSLAQEDIKKTGINEEKIAPVLYRPFDIRYTYYTGQTRGFICMPRLKVMRHMLAGENMGIIFPRRVEIAGAWTHTLVTNKILEHVALSLKTIDSLFPLYLYPDPSKPLGKVEHWPAGEGGRRPNLSPDFIRELERKLGLRFIADNCQLEAGVTGMANCQLEAGATDIFHYIYAVFHSPTYRKRYAEFLKIDFPRVPLTSDVELFRRLCELGGELVSLHLMRSPALDEHKINYPERGDDTVEKGYPKYVEKDERVYINKKQYFQGAPGGAWEFRVGGYQVLHKWLKDRRGRQLTSDDRARYRKIIMAISETIRIMNEIDDAIGEWPINP